MTIAPRPPLEGSPHELAPPFPSASLDAATLDLVRRSAAHAEGLVLLERGNLECVAVLLRAHPRAVERVRRLLEDPAVRAAAADAFEAARPRALAVPAVASRPAAPRTPESVLRDAERREGGLALLAHAASECAAIVFGVTPSVVRAARALLEARGIPAAPSADE